MSNHRFIPNTVIPKLRDYQKKALDKMVTYLHDYSHGKTKGTGLVAMPTGSGKTPIMAVLARCYSGLSGVLIVSPRTAISSQLYQEISDNLFKSKFCITEEIPKEVYYFSTNFEEFNENIGNSVIITTIQKIDSLRRENLEQFNFLKNNIELVLFDEGHYEPAVSWSTTIREFKCPRVIFSATPFRNDFKTFDIDWNYHYFTNYDSLRAKKYLRNVQFISKAEIENREDKIDDILNSFDIQFGSNSKSKVIINCDNRDSILELAKLLHKRNRQFIAIHEAFNKQFVSDLHTDYSSSLHRKVPDNPQDVPERIWIHQYKLLEGIDDYTFQMVVIFEPLRNVRSLIQQVGRVIRNPFKEDAPAVVIDYTNKSYKEEWTKYVSIDKSGQIIKGFSGSIFEILDKQLPASVYFNGRLREKLILSEFQTWSIEELKQEIRIPLKVNLLQLLPNFEFEKFLEDVIEKRFNDRDYIKFSNPAGNQSMLYLYFDIKNSSYLTTKFYPEIRQGLCFIKVYDGFLAFYDSHDYTPYGKDKAGIGTGVQPKALKALFKDGNDTTLTRISLKNSNLGSREIRSHSFVAPSIQETTPYLNDFSHYLDSAFGFYSEQKTFKAYKNATNKTKSYQLRTYIGFSTGRISQNEPENLTFSEYLDWLTYITSIVKNNRQHIDTFNRYASEQAESNNIPRNILLDLFDFENDLKFFGDVETNDLSEVIPDKCLDIEEIKIEGNNHYIFSLEINDESYSIEISYDVLKKKYILKSPDVSAAIIGHTKTFDNKTMSLITILNERQAFRIITDDNLVYSKGSFYCPVIKKGSSFGSEDIQIQHILYPINRLSEIGSEKGKVARDANHWEEKTIFNLIDTKGKGTKFSGYFAKEGFMVCDDMGVEIADFILVEKERLVFIHAKGIGNKVGKTSKKVSASAISEVCNQAIKNIHYISMFDDSKPTKLNSWSSEYICKNDRTGVNIRIENRRRGSSSDMPPQDIWKEISKKKFDPNCNKEVWLVLGKMFSKQEFISKLLKNKPDAVAVQAALTLQSTLANIGSMGAKLRVFCSK